MTDEEIRERVAGVFARYMRGEATVEDVRACMTELVEHHPDLYAGLMRLLAEHGATDPAEIARYT